jgi:hypothetical protein
MFFRRQVQVAGEYFVELIEQGKHSLQVLVEIHVMVTG